MLFFRNKNSSYFKGTAQSVGCSVERCPPHDIIDKINSGEVEVPDVSI